MLLQNLSGVPGALAESLKRKIICSLALRLKLQRQIPTRPRILLKTKKGKPIGGKVPFLLSMMVNIESTMGAGSAVFSTGATIKAAPIYTFSLYPLSNWA